MNISATILLAFGMSMDAFAASIGKGATSTNLNSLKPCAPG
jgi:putative Mn2+ efflux pump MntP